MATKKMAFVKTWKVDKAKIDDKGEIKEESKITITMECETNEDMVQLLTEATISGKGVKFNPIQLTLTESRTA